MPKLVTKVTEFGTNSMKAQKYLSKLVLVKQIKQPFLTQLVKEVWGQLLFLSLNIGVAIKETFTNQHTANIGQLPLNTLIFQDDISKMNDDIEQAREGCQKIDRTLKSKLLSANYDKSKFLIIGKEKSRKSTLEILGKDPLHMGGVKIEHSVQEKYLGDWISEKGCKESITVTIKARTRLISIVSKPI